MEIEDKSNELRFLQKKAFGRDGDASTLELKRLAELQSSGSTDDPAAEVAPNETLTSHAVETAGTLERPRGLDAPRVRGSVPLRGIFAIAGGALLLGLLAGTWIGASTSSASRPAQELPSIFTGYDAGSVTYFGSIESIEVWTAQTSDGEERCLLTLGDPLSETGGSTCLPDESKKNLSIAFSGPTTETARRYTVVKQDDGTSVLVYDTVDVDTLQSSG